MKKYILLLLLPCFFYSCFKEDQQGQYPTDSVPPGQVKSATVQNVAGGAIISYAVPDDEDLLYVKAVYTLDNGTVMEVKASEYTNSLTIEGIGRSREVSVQLICGDRSKNESKPFIVTTHPLDSPIYAILASIQGYNDFGGIRLTWSNPTLANVVLAITTKDKTGASQVAQNFYTNSAIGNGNLRGYPSVQTQFGFCLRDRWGNLTDTIRSNFTPLFETQVLGKFARWNPTGIPYQVYSSYNIENLWDNNISTFFLISPIVFPQSFTLDLGYLVKFSRIHIWQRQGPTLVYITQAVKTFQIWGSATPFVTDDFLTWTKIGDFTCFKPSGSPVGTNTSDDLAYAIAGQDYNIDAATAPYRYLRFVVQSTWSNDTAFSFGEMQFFGSVQ